MYNNIENTLDSLFSWSSTPRIIILIAISNKPGISFLELKYQCGIGRNHLQYHLDILTSQNHLIFVNNTYYLDSWVSEFLQACHDLSLTYSIDNPCFLYQINSIKKQSCLKMWDYLFQASSAPTITQLSTVFRIDKTSIRKYIKRSIQAQFISQSKAQKKSLRQLHLTQKGIDTFRVIWKHIAPYSL